MTRRNDAGQRVDEAGIRVAPRRRRIARLLTETLAPAPLVAVLLLLVAWRTATTPLQAVTTGAIAALFASVIPFAYILRGVRRGRLTDHHVGVREQRLIPLVIGAVSVVTGTGLLAAVGASREVIALVVAMLAGLVSALLVTLWWKISVHTAVAAGAATVFVIVLGPALVAATPLVGAIAWARVEVGDHTPAQTVAGAVLGTTIAATVFPALR